MDEQISSSSLSPEVNFNNKKDLWLSLTAGFLCGLLFIPYYKIMGKTEVGLWKGLLFVIGFSAFAPIGMTVAFWLRKKMMIFYQVAKFILVGGLNTLVDWGVLALLIGLVGAPTDPVYIGFKGFSFVAASTNSYFWNKFWTFQKNNETKKEEGGSKEFLKFFIVSLIGFALNLGVAYLIVRVLGVQFGFNGNQWKLVGAMAGTIAGLVWNFLGYKLVVFKE